MSTVIGDGAFTYEAVENWAKLPDGWVYVADRENHRIQVVDGDGNYETQWNNLHRPSGLCMQCCSVAASRCATSARSGRDWRFNRDSPNLGPRVSFLTHKGELLARLGDVLPGLAESQFISPHGKAVDSHGDILVGEVAGVAWPDIFPDRPKPEPLRTFRKLVRQ